MWLLSSFICVLFTTTIASGFNFYDGRPKRQEFGGFGDCRTPDGIPGRCINIKACPSMIVLLKQVGFNPEAREYLLNSRCGFEGRDPKVCCQNDQPNNNGNFPNPDTTKRPTIPNIDENPQPIPDDRPQPNINNNNNNNIGNDDAPEKFPRRCGKKVTSVNRIIGGRPANLRAWPWIVALGYRSSNKQNPISWNCGGTLVTDRHVITAAHCLAGKRVVMVRLGDLDLNTTDDGANHIDVPADRTIVHQDYNAARHTTDIGIVRLRNPVQFNDDIQPICLPFSENLKTKPLVGFSPFIAGWGALAFKAATFPTRLFEAQVEIKSQEDCNAAYNRLPRNPVVIDDRVICAGGDKTDACQGDSGGPLMLPLKGLFHLYGVVSYGYKCAEPGFPGVYTKVSQFVDWINDNTNY